MIDDDAVRGAIYGRVLTTGSIPSAHHVSVDVDSSVEEVHQSFARLAAARVIALQSQGGEILMAPPFSAVPTSFLVIAGAIETFANCIWDALGVLAILRRDGEVRTACGCCSSAMTLSVRNGALQPHEGIVHFAVPAKKWWDNIVFT
jgi:hypothetical protein